MSNVVYLNSLINVDVNKNIFKLIEEELNKHPVEIIPGKEVFLESIKSAEVTLPDKWLSAIRIDLSLEEGEEEKIDYIRLNYKSNLNSILSDKEQCKLRTTILEITSYPSTSRVIFKNQDKELDKFMEIKDKWVTKYPDKVWSYLYLVLEVFNFISENYTFEVEELEKSTLVTVVDPRCKGHFTVDFSFLGQIDTYWAEHYN